MIVMTTGNLPLSAACMTKHPWRPSNCCCLAMSTLFLLNNAAGWCKGKVLWLHSKWQCNPPMSHSCPDPKNQGLAMVKAAPTPSRTLCMQQAYNGYLATSLAGSYDRPW